jgi:hypothetical protein
MDLNFIAKCCPLHGQTLNVEEVAGLEVGMMQRKLHENLPGNFFFLGKNIWFDSRLSHCLSSQSI